MNATLARAARRGAPSPRSLAVRPAAMPCFFTIGHSTRSFSEFLALLRAAAITRVIDVRAIPHSAANPQFGRDALAASLAAAGIGYEHSPELGGLRGRTRQIPP